AGLEWVHTDAERHAAVQQEIASVVPAPHPPRERKPAPALPEGPMVLVETRTASTQPESAA
ncbi:MAG TPA: hypothetical protein VM512_06635, partial [Burkholderiaceae bacterium]|nr:hypothetical protein [Burkholderiaceae bacterium]